MNNRVTANLRPGATRAAILLFFSTALFSNLLAQTLSKEYVRLGGRVVAIESFSFSVTPNPPPTVPGPGTSLSFSASRPANWSISPTTAGYLSPSAGVSTNLTVANPIPAGVTSITLIAADQSSSATKSVIVPLMTPIVISGAVSTLPAGGQAQYSANIPVTWELSPANAGAVSPASTATNGLTTVTISSNPPGNPATVTLLARDARAATDSRFQNNTSTRVITIQYGGGPPSATGYISSSYYNNGSAAAGWTFAFTDPQGPQNIAWMAVHFSGINSQSIPYSCALYVYPAYNGYSYLWNDTQSGVAAGDIGQDAPLRNSQCLIDMKGLRFYDQGGIRYLEVPAYFNPQFIGQRDIYLSVGNNQGQMQQGAWLKAASGWPIYYLSSVSSSAVHPTQGTMVNQKFRTSAFNILQGGEVPMMGMYAKDAYNNVCQLFVFPGINWAYAFSNGIYDTSNLTVTSYVLTTPRCSVPISTVKFTSYVQMSPPAPYTFLDAQIQANSPIRGTVQSMFGTMYYTINGAWYPDYDRYLGFWTIPGSL